MDSMAITLRNGAKMPMIGLGTFQSTDEDGVKAVKTALQAGYRHLDTAQTYKNEAAVGRGIRESGILRAEIFVTDKLANTWHSRAEEALSSSLELLGLDYLDLWLMHWPTPLNAKGNDWKFPTKADGSPDYEEGWDYLRTWKSMEEVFRKHPDKVKAIGVSNCSIALLKKLLSIATVQPVANQVELHPALPQDKLVQFCQEKGIVLIAYSPLGSPKSPLMSDARLQSIAEKNKASLAQCLISWGVQRGYAVLPKSSNPSRIQNNLKIVRLSDEDMASISSTGQLNPKRTCTPGWSIGLFDEE